MRGIIKKQIKVSEIHSAQAYIASKDSGYIVVRLPPVTVYGPITQTMAQAKVRNMLHEQLHPEAVILIEDIIEQFQTYQMDTEKFIQMADPVPMKKADPASTARKKERK